MNINKTTPVVIAPPVVEVTLKDSVLKMSTNLGEPRAKLHAHVYLSGKPYEGRGLNGFTERHGAVLGAPVGHSAKWVGLWLSKDDSDLLARFSEHCGLAAEGQKDQAGWRVLERVLSDWFGKNRSAMEAEVGSAESLTEAQKKQAELQLARAEEATARYKKMLGR